MQRRQSSAALVAERDAIVSRLPTATKDDTGLCLYVLVLNGSTQNITIKWLMQWLTQSGQHLELTRLPNPEGSDPDADIVLHVGAPTARLNLTAEAIDLKQLRPDDKVCRVFRINFDLSSGVANSLTLSEKQRALLFQIESLHVVEKGVLFGYPHCKLYPGQSIIQVCQRENIITDYFPLHESSDLDQLKNKWCFSMNKQPIHDIRNYFGEQIAFYFAFLEFYTNCLLIPATVGVIQFLFFDEMNIFCALFYMLWIPIFLKQWKRRQNELAYQWGTIGDVLLEGPRPTFRGKHMKTDPITKSPTPVYPIYKTWLREYGISLPIVMLCLGIAFHVMCLYFRLEAQLYNYYQSDPKGVQKLFVMMPGIIYALIVMVMNHMYRQIATKLNEWENHRTQTSHENHWIIKLVLFEFVNNFMSLFYIAFYLKDLSMLKWQLATMLVVNQLVDNVQETLIPLFKTYRLNKNFELSRKKSDLSERISRINYENKLPSYEGTYYDYLELYIQFGYIFLFLSIFPLAPIIAFANNYVEIRSDAIKLCYGYKRPHQRSAKSINGAWMKAFEVMGIMSVMTNCALLSMSPTIHSISRNYSLDNFHLMVTAEHIILAVILVISYVVPDMPKPVSVALLKQKYDRGRLKIETALAFKRDAD